MLLIGLGGYGTEKECNLLRAITETNPSVRIPILKNVDPAAIKSCSN